MTVSVRDARGSESDRLWIEGVYRDYLNDLAPSNTGLFPILGEIGHREPDQTARWFRDPNTFPFLILRARTPVGFAMVTRTPPTLGAKTSLHRMTEFFIARQYRRLGLGRSAVHLLLSRFSGRWEVVEYSNNIAAIQFWRRVVSAYTRGRYTERVVNDEVRQTFETRGDGRR